jgi:hypothetical protein
VSANKVLERAQNAAQKYLDRAPDPMPKAEAISACALVLVQVEEELYKLKSEIETLKESRAVAVDCEQTSRNEANRLRGELEGMRKSFVPLSHVPHHHVHDHSKDGTDAADQCAACGKDLRDSIHLRIP